MIDESLGRQGLVATRLPLDALGSALYVSRNVQRGGVGGAAAKDDTKRKQHTLQPPLFPDQIKGRKVGTKHEEVILEAAQ